ncbi:MFS transporter [Aspergillus eucalypticola CBS 122712]|uniref:Citrate exporter 1 n=1 Tax=Aspergillus eucalypticola (strain CBS 122712 / IBT 29274) TaxID=1448314 RepID=A0A317WCJ5_ASPEC|nr:MFS transporter [Aspergillus eucalypticola CBS 122712]PWY84256.1 MFS transporter [Aspergillus eucalypticola CBS 122712]
MATKKSKEEYCDGPDTKAERMPSDTESPVEDPDLAPVETEVYSTFSRRKRALIVLIASVASVFSSLSANIYLPATDTIADQFHVSDTLINLTLSTYMIFQGLAPTFFGGLADNAGRRPAYILCFIAYIAANIGLALQRNYAALLILRCLQSAGGSSTIALANAIVADVVTTAERGEYIGYVSAGFIIGPSVGPIIGGLLTQFLGWPFIFWLLAILAGAFVIVLVIFLPETARKVVGNGSRSPPIWNLSGLQLCSRRQRAEAHSSACIHLSFPNPLKALTIIFHKDVFLILLGNGVAIAGYFAVTGTITSQFSRIYGFNEVQIGLCYLPLGVGNLIAAYTQGKITDWNYQRHAHSQGIDISSNHRPDLDKFAIERPRAEVVLPQAIGEALSMIAYGWVLHYETNLAGPLVLLLLIGYTSAAVMNTLSALMVDIYPESPAMATAAMNLTRCWLGAGAAAAILPLIDAIGNGWAFTVIGFMCFVCVPAMVVVWIWGYDWRRQRH